VRLFVGRLVEKFSRPVFAETRHGQLPSGMPQLWGPGTA